MICRLTEHHSLPGMVFKNIAGHDPFTTALFEFKAVFKFGMFDVPTEYLVIGKRRLEGMISRHGRKFTTVEFRIAVNGIAIKNIIYVCLLTVRRINQNAVFPAFFKSIVFKSVKMTPPAQPQCDRIIPMKIL